jgi:hypothetical protein
LIKTVHSFFNRHAPLMAFSSICSHNTS